MIFKKSSSRYQTRKKVVRKKNTSFYFDNIFSGKKVKKKRRGFSLKIPTHYKHYKLHYRYGCFILFLVIGVFFVFGPIMRVENIYVNREDKIVDINRSYESLNTLRGKNILFINSSEIIERLKKQQKSIQSVRLSAKFPNTLNIQIASYGIIFQNETSFILSNGLLVDKKGSISDVPYINFLEKGEGEFITRKQLSEKNLNTLRVMLNLLQKNLIGLKLSEIFYFEQEREVMISLENGTQLFFDLDGDTQEQVKKLSIYNRDTVNISSNAFTYIDLRIPQRIHICPLEEENICNNNIEKIYGSKFFQSKKLRINPGESQQ